MKFFLVLFVLAPVYGLSQKPNPGSKDGQWNLPNGGPNNGIFQWGPPNGGESNKPDMDGPQEEKGENENEEWKPESRCAHIIPKSARTTIIAPLMANEVTINSVYPCDSDSRLKQISFSGISLTEPEVTCSGVYVLTNDGEINYQITFCDKHGRTRKEILLLTNYTIVSTYNNGNYDFLECGVVLKGRCAGDLWVGSGVYQVDDSNGCASPGGVSGSSALVRKIEIKGKCSSKCGLGSSVTRFSQAINNLGYAEPTHIGYGEENVPAAENQKSL